VAAWLLLACATPTTGWVVEVRGAVIDPDWEPIGDAEVSLLSADGAWMGSSTTDSTGAWRLPVAFESSGQVAIQVQADRSGRASSTLYTSLLLRDLPDPIPLRVGPGQQLAMATVHVPPVVLALDGEGVGSGTVFDATTGLAVPRLQFTLHRGWNAPASAAIETVGATDADGEFSLAAPAGTYTAVSDAQAGLARTVFPVVVAPEEVRYQRGFVVPPPGEPELRAALAWDGARASLDLHVTGPKGGSDNDEGRFNVYESDPIFPNSGDPVAQLEFSSPGNEAITVNRHLSDGLYRVSAHDIGNAQEPEVAEKLSQSAALAWIWWEEEVWLETAPYGVAATVWRAMELEVSDGTLTRLQQLDTSTTGADLGAF